MVGYALPGGIVTKETYNSLVDKSLSLLKKNLPYDGVLFDIHGAMSVEGVDDPEGDYIEKVREIIGKEPIKIYILLFFACISAFKSKKPSF